MNSIKQTGKMNAIKREGSHQRFSYATVGQIVLQSRLGKTRRGTIVPDGWFAVLATPLLFGLSLAGCDPKHSK